MPWIYMAKEKFKKGGSFMLMKYGRLRGRELLKEMVAQKDETIMSFYNFLKEYYPYLLTRQQLYEEEIRRYNSLADANVLYVEVRKAIQITKTKR